MPPRGLVNPLTAPVVQRSVSTPTTTALGLQSVSQIASSAGLSGSQVEKLKEFLSKALTTENRALHIAKSKPAPKLGSRRGRKAQAPTPVPIQLDDEVGETELENDDESLLSLGPQLVQSDSEPEETGIANMYRQGSDRVIAPAPPHSSTTTRSSTPSTSASSNLSRQGTFPAVAEQSTALVSPTIPVEINAATGLPTTIWNELKSTARMFGAMHELFMPNVGDESFYNQCAPTIGSDFLLPLRSSANPEDRQLCLLVSLYKAVPGRLQPLIRGHTSFRLIFEPTIREGRKHWITNIRECIGSIYSLPADICGLALLKGPAAAKRAAEGTQGRVSSPPTNSKRWGVTSVTEGFIICVFIIVWFILSNDTEFTVVGAKSGIEYEELYHYHCDLLSQGRNTPAIRTTLAFWDNIIFPNQSAIPNKTQAKDSTTHATARRHALTDRLAKLHMTHSDDTTDAPEEPISSGSTQAAATFTAYVSAPDANPPTAPTTIQATASIEVSSNPTSAHVEGPAVAAPRPVPRKKAKAPLPPRRAMRRTPADDA
ncbi:hypothetical protein BD779DRAFT_1682544 [Infundibulicybe gibba]|nr:hypothetical protein BD779DRAFT_1682544 [Infundibulicybe gibba]